MLSHKQILTWIAATTVILAGTKATGWTATGTPFVVGTGLKNPIPWHVFYPTILVTVDPSAGMRDCYFQNAFTKAISPMTRTGPIPGAWEAYGSYQKWLLYLDPTIALPRLMSHDVDSGPNYTAAYSSYKQVGCGMSANRMIYGQYRANSVNGIYPVDLNFYNVQTGANTPHVVSDSEKMQFSHDGTTLVYRAVFGGQSGKIYGVLFSGGPEFLVSDHDGYAPSISGNLAAWYEPSGGGFNILAKDLSTGETRTVAFTTANPPRPSCANGTILWEDARNQGSSGIDIYGYDWASASEFPVTTAAGNQLNLIAGDDLVVWTSGSGNNQTLHAAKIVQPVTIADFRAISVTQNTVTLAWTSSGFANNPPTAYELRMRTDGPVTEANWASSTVVAGLPSPGAPGQLESFQVAGLSSGYHYFALKERLQDLSYSQLSTSVKAYCSAQPEAMEASEGSYISIAGVVEAVGADGAVYVQRDNAASALKVGLLTGQIPPPAGRNVIVTGRLEQDSVFYGPYLNASTVSDMVNNSTVRTYTMNQHTLGGNDSRFGGTAEGGLSNIWLSVRIAGRVWGISSSGNTWSFYLQDGSRPLDNSGQGVLVVTCFSPPPGLVDGSFATVEGISQLARSGGRRIEVTDPGGVVVH